MSADSFLNPIFHQPSNLHADPAAADPASTNFALTIIFSVFGFDLLRTASVNRL